MADRECSRCGGVFDEETFFRKAHSTRNCRWREARHYVCIGCEQTARDEKKYANRALVKARSSLRTHAAKYIARGVVATKAEFVERFDWDVKQMAHDINFEYGNGCRRCRRSYATMGNGLADITLDIIDPQALPYYRTNVRWICKTCNTAKGATRPDDDGKRLEAWTRWERQQEERRQAKPVPASFLPPPRRTRKHFTDDPLF